MQPGLNSVVHSFIIMSMVHVNSQTACVHTQTHNDQHESDRVRALLILLQHVAEITDRQNVSASQPPFFPWLLNFPHCILYPPGNRGNLGNKAVTKREVERKRARAVP